MGRNQLPRGTFSAPQASLPATPSLLARKILKTCSLRLGNELRAFIFRVCEPGGVGEISFPTHPTMFGSAQPVSPWTMQKFHLPLGDAGVYKTVSKMQQLVIGPVGVGSGLVRAAALEATRGSVRDCTEIDSVFHWVKQNIEFRGEAEETLQSPEATLRMGGGDCDDHAMLLAAMLKSLGYAVQFKTVAVERDSPEEFSHVYAVVLDKVSGQWVPLDTTVRESYPGWEPSDISRSQMYLHKQLGRASHGPVHRQKRRPNLSALGDDNTTDAYYSAQTIQDVSAPVPIPMAPAGISPNQALTYNLVAPFAQAGASLLAHGQTAPALPVAFGSSNLTMWALVGVGVVGIGIWALKR